MEESSEMPILEVEIEGFEITFLDYGSFLKWALGRSLCRIAVYKSAAVSILLHMIEAT